MEALRSAAAFLLPWEFSPAVVLACVVPLVLYARGMRRGTGGSSAGRRIAFVVGIVLVYAVMQTHIDFLSQHMFFIHRLQHLVLHHTAPFLIAWSWPLAVLARGMPPRAHAALYAVRTAAPVRTVYRVVQNAFVAPVLFVGLIAFWLTPAVHFDAMLSGRLYAVMNWSMLIDGLLFWMLMLDPRTREQGALLALGPRVLIVLAASIPQILIGAHITFAAGDLYDVYDVCGRAWDVSARTDQRLGGLITWIPAAMMHVVGALVIISRWMHSDRGRAATATAAARR